MPPTPPANGAQPPTMQPSRAAALRQRHNLNFVRSKLGLASLPSGSHNNNIDSLLGSASSACTESSAGASSLFAIDGSVSAATLSDGEYTDASTPPSLSPVSSHVTLPKSTTLQRNQNHLAGDLRDATVTDDSGPKKFVSFDDTARPAGDSTIALEPRVAATVQLQTSHEVLLSAEGSGASDAGYGPPVTGPLVYDAMEVAALSVLPVLLLLQEQAQRLSEVDHSKEEGHVDLVNYRHAADTDIEMRDPESCQWFDDDEDELGICVEGLSPALVLAALVYEVREVGCTPGYHSGNGGCGPVPPLEDEDVDDDDHDNDSGVFKSAAGVGDEESEYERGETPESGDEDGLTRGSWSPVWPRPEGHNVATGPHDEVHLTDNNKYTGSEGEPGLNGVLESGKGEDDEPHPCMCGYGYGEMASEDAARGVLRLLDRFVALAPANAQARPLRAWRAAWLRRLADRWSKRRGIASPELSSDVHQTAASVEAAGVVPNVQNSVGDLGDVRSMMPGGVYDQAAAGAPKTPQLQPVMDVKGRTPSPLALSWATPVGLEGGREDVDVDMDVDEAVVAQTAQQQQQQQEEGAVPRALESHDAAVDSGVPQTSVVGDGGVITAIARPDAETAVIDFCYPHPPPIFAKDIAYLLATPPPPPPPPSLSSSSSCFPPSSSPRPLPTMLATIPSRESLESLFSEAGLYSDECGPPELSTLVMMQVAEGGPGGGPGGKGNEMKSSSFLELGAWCASSASTAAAAANSPATTYTSGTDCQMLTVQGTAARTATGSVTATATETATATAATAATVVAAVATTAAVAASSPKWDASSKFEVTESSLAGENLGAPASTAATVAPINITI